MAVSNVIYGYSCHTINVFFSINIRDKRATCTLYSYGLAGICLEYIFFIFTDYFIIVKGHLFNSPGSFFSSSINKAYLIVHYSLSRIDDNTSFPDLIWMQGLIMLDASHL